MKKVDVLKLDDNKFNKLVKIAGTNFDRRRKLSVKTIEKIRKAYNNHKKSIKELAEENNVSYTAIKYHVDSRFKHNVNFMRTLYDFKPAPANYVSELISYKRDLVRSGKLKVNNI